MPFRKSSRSIQNLPAPVRLGFPNLLEPKPVTFNGQPKGDPIYSARIVIHKDQVETVELIKRMMTEIVREAWADIPPPNDFHWALQWGPQAYPNDQNVADCWVLNANARLANPPEIVKPGQRPGTVVQIDPNNVADRAMIYSGMEAHVYIGLFAYQSTAREGGIGCGLNAVLCTGRDVGRFDSRVSAASAFGSVLADMAAHANAPAPQGGPQQGFGGPGLGAPQQGFGVPQQGFGGPGAGAPAPQQGFGGPGAGAPQQGFGGPGAGAPAPQQGFGGPGMGDPGSNLPW